LESHSPQANSLQHAWGLPPYQSGSAASILPQVLAELQKAWDQNGEAILDVTMKRMERMVPTFVTFAESLVDQEYWERLSGTALVDESTVETNLVLLIQSFLTYLTLDTLLSPDLLEQRPDIAPLIMTFPAHLKNLLFGTASSFISPNSKSVVRSLIINIQPFLDAVFPSKREVGLAYEDVEDLESMFLETFRMEAIQKAPDNVQNSVFLYVLTLSLIPHAIVPWALMKILLPSSDIKMEPLLKEAEKQVEVEGGIWTPEPTGIVPLPDVKINANKNSASINSLIAETTQEYARGYTGYKVTKDFTLKDPESFSTSASGSWQFLKNDQLIAAHWLSSAELEVPTGDDAIPEALKQRKCIMYNFESVLTLSSWVFTLAHALKLLCRNLPSIHSRSSQNV
jgi:hypothetical protein